MTSSSQALFPPNPPASMTDRREITRNDWTAFSELDTMVDHWARPAWPDGAEAYYWLLPLGSVSELRGQVLACQAALAAVPDLDAVPCELLHLTVHRVGAAASVTREQLAEIAETAANRLKAVEPVHLIIGPLAGSSAAIRYTVSPWHRLFAVRGCLTSATQSVLGAAPESGWRPHVSIAYNALPRAAAPILDRVRALRVQPPVEATVTDIELVKLVRAGHVYRWTTMHRLTLVGTRTTDVRPSGIPAGPA